jgi:hypothetical protein
MPFPRFVIRRVIDGHPRIIRVRAKDPSAAHITVIPRGNLNAFNSLLGDHIMLAPKCPARTATKPPCVRLRRSPRKTEIVVEGTVPIILLALIATAYVGYLLH